MAKTRTKRADSEDAAIFERQFKALELRKDGWSYRDIGAKLGVSYTQAHRDVEEELRRLAQLNQDKAEELRQLELEKLDALEKAVSPMANVGQPAAVTLKLKVMERRAKLLGLDAPAKTDVTTGGEKMVPIVITQMSVDEL